MKVELTTIVKILDEKFALAQKRDNYEMMSLIVDVKQQVMFAAELQN